MRFECDTFSNLIASQYHKSVLFNKITYLKSTENLSNFLTVNYDLDFVENLGQIFTHRH